MYILNLTIDASLYHFLFFTSLHVGVTSIADHAVSSSDRTDALGFTARGLIVQSLIRERIEALLNSCRGQHPMLSTVSHILNLAFIS